MATRIKQRTENRAKNIDRRPRAVAKDIGVSPSKVRIVLNLIRGKDYTMADAILNNMPNIGAKEAVKVLESAGANAQNNLGMNKANLYVAEAYADGAATLKRFQPVSKGRAHSIKKRTCHITIILDEKKA